MHWIRLPLAVIALQAVAACSLLEEKPEPVPLPEAPPVEASQPAEELPFRPLPQVVPKPAVKPAAATTKPAKTAKPAASRTEGKPAASAGSGSAESAPRAEAPAAVRQAQTARKSAAASPARNEPEWLQGCSGRQQSGAAILCDANALLIQPSAKVQVYTREPSLVRTTPGGAISLRESLPKLYRFFVLP